MALVMVAYGGTEVIGVAAAETRDPERSVPAAKTHVPCNAVFASAAGLYAGVLAYLLSPATAFVAITSIASFGFMLVWLIIALSHLRFHKSMLQRNPGALKYVAPGYPYTSIASALLLVGVIWVLWLIPEQRIGVLGGLATLGIVSFYYLVTRRLFMTPRPRTAESLRLASFFGFDAAPSSDDGAESPQGEQQPKES